MSDRIVSSEASHAGLRPPADGRPPYPQDRRPSEMVYEELLSRILSSELGPNERITIDAVGREIGISQTPVREALHRLSAEGIVVHHRHAGYRVAPKLSREQFEHLIEVRQVLEPLSASNAAENMRRETIEQLEKLNQRMASVLERDDAERAYAVFSRLDAEFHDLIATSGGNPYIRDALHRLHTHAHLFRLANHDHITSLAVGEHTAIVEALRMRDPGEAALAARHHIKLSAQRFRAGFD